MVVPSQKELFTTLAAAPDLFYRRVPVLPINLCRSTVMASFLFYNFFQTCSLVATIQGVDIPYIYSGPGADNLSFNYVFKSDADTWHKVCGQIGEAWFLA